MTKPLVTQRPRARVDILEQFVYFGEQATVELAERYLAAIQTTCHQLLKQPHSGTFMFPGLSGSLDCVDFR